MSKISKAVGWDDFKAAIATISSPDLYAAAVDLEKPSCDK